MDTGLCLVKPVWFLSKLWFGISFWVQPSLGIKVLHVFFVFFLSFHCCVPSCCFFYLSMEVATHRLNCLGAHTISEKELSVAVKMIRKMYFTFWNLSCSMFDVKFPFKALICRQSLSQLRFVNVNFTPCVPIQFVIPGVEDRDERWWILVGLWIKRDVFEKYRFKSEVVPNLAL